ncbi:hypothetical protein SEPCBS119000_004803 [Sporothrix epigloea]|uniref:Transcriptional activator n=1 Tax=Sporothrix epigloea TaxID=1892477 RepID=A0ABP0DU51_9PEZI
MFQPGTGRAGVVTCPSDGNGMDQLASAVLDDLLYNVIHDLIMKTHRDEKQARAATAAIRVETLAAKSAQDQAGATGESRPMGLFESDAALYQSGEVTLKKNPLKTTTDILCQRCHLPRLLHPTDGRGAHKPDPNVSYCKKHPYIDKPGCDIYGQMWVAPGPGRGKKKKDFDKKVSAAIHAATTGIEGTDEKGAANGTTEQRPPNVLSFPSATCSKCKRCILVSRLNNHMGSCIGNSGRNASRAAAAKISSNGSVSGRDSVTADHTPPSSRKGTPLPSSQGSPRKREADEFDDEGLDGAETASVNGSNTTKPKKKLKSLAAASRPIDSGLGTPSSSQGLSLALNKKLTLKSKNLPDLGSPTSVSGGSIKKQKPKPRSALSSEQKISDSYDDEEEEDDDGESNDGDYVDDDSPYKQRRGGRIDDDDDYDDDDNRADTRNSLNSKPSNSSNSIGKRNGTAATSSSTPLAANGKPRKSQKLHDAASALSASNSSPKKTTKVPLPSMPGKKVKLVKNNGVDSLNNKATLLSSPAYKNGGGGGRARAGSESSGTMSSPRG